MPYSINERFKRLLVILCTLLLSYASFFLILAFAGMAGFDFSFIKPIDPIMPLVMAFVNTNFMIAFFIIDIPIFLFSFFGWITTFNAWESWAPTPTKEEVDEIFDTLGGGGCVSDGFEAAKADHQRRMEEERRHRRGR